MEGPPSTHVTYYPYVLIDGGGRDVQVLAKPPVAIDIHYMESSDHKTCTLCLLRGHMPEIQDYHLPRIVTSD